MNIIKAVDSEFPPSAVSLASAKAAGVTVWSGYLAGPNIAHGWTEADFAAVRAAGLYSLAYASGYTDPLLMKAQAEAWGVKGCLDVESGIRGDGTWVQPWLTSSGFGLYGNAPVHENRTAAFHILAAYPGKDPGTNWPAGPLPAKGWQWAGSVHQYEATVDLNWIDEAIFVPTSKPSTGVPQMFIWYQLNGTISLCNGEKRIGFGDGGDVGQFSAFPSVHESNVTIAFAAKINALPYV